MRILVGKNISYLKAKKLIWKEVKRKVGEGEMTLEL